MERCFASDYGPEAFLTTLDYSDMESNSFENIKSKIANNEIDSYTLLGLDKYPDDLPSFVAEIDQFIESEDPPRWIILRTVNAHLNNNTSASIERAAELAIEHRISNADTLQYLREGLASLQAPVDFARIISVPYENEQIKRTVIARSIRALLSDDTKREFAIHVLTALDSINEGDHVPPLVILEAFDLSDGLANQDMLGAFVRNREPDAKYLRIVRKLTQDVDMLEESYRANRQGSRFEEKIIEASVPTVKLKSPLNRFNHPLAFKGDKSLVSKTLKSDVIYREYECVYLYGISYGFVVLDSNFRPVGMHNPYITPKLLALIQAKKSTVTDIDNLAFFADSFTPNNYCHFVVDHLPRILWMQQLRDAKVFGAFEISMSKYQKAYFELAKIRRGNILSLERHKLYRVEKLKVMNTSGTDFMHCFNGGNEAYAMPVMDLANLPIVQKQKVKTSKKIALVRPKELGRSFTNNDEVISALKKSGFTLIDPGSHSVVEQIAMMQRADFVLGIHGAALTNIIFCKPRTKVLEVFPPLYGTLAFYTISLAADLEYDVCVGKSDARALSIGAAGRLDFELPLDTLNEALARFEGK